MTACNEQPKRAVRMNHFIASYRANVPMIARAKLIGILVLGLLLAAGSGSTAQPKTSPSSAAFSQTETLLQQRRLAEAKTEALEQLKRHPSSVEGYNLLGIIETSQQDYAAAMASFQKALQLSPRSVKTHNNLGNFYVAQQQTVPAEKEFRTVLSLDPATAEAN